MEMGGRGKGLVVSNQNIVFVVRVQVCRRREKARLDVRCRKNLPPASRRSANRTGAVQQHAGDPHRSCPARCQWTPRAQRGCAAKSKFGSREMQDTAPHSPHQRRNTHHLPFPTPKSAAEAAAAAVAAAAAESNAGKLAAAPTHLPARPSGMSFQELLGVDSAGELSRLEGRRGRGSHGCGQPPLTNREE